jgi:GNAT superfamily N-acetyltransferase
MANAQYNSKVSHQKPKEVEVRLVEKWSIEDIVELYKVGGWWREHYDPAGIPELIQGSYAFVVAVDLSSGKAIGMGRIISDGVSDAYIQDVVVLKAWRGKGLGIRIVKTLLNYCLENKLQWIGLIAEPGTKAFYTPLGFQVLPGEPMVYKPEPED